MPQAYWVCQGIGLEQKVFMPLLDGDKLAKAVFANAEIALGKLEEHSFSSLSNDAKVELLMDEYIDMETFRLPELLQKEDHENLLEACCDGDGQYFLLYPPRYPWEKTGEFINQTAAIEYICDVVMPFCRDDVARQQIIDIIDADIYEVGCG